MYCTSEAMAGLSLKNFVNSSTTFREFGEAEGRVIWSKSNGSVTDRHSLETCEVTCSTPLR